MQKWEYLEIYTNSTFPPDRRTIYTINGVKLQVQIPLYQYMAQLGSEGWELIIQNDNYLIFKRPID